jgi:DNA-binding transcriptional ArsR family regulator
MRGRSAAPNTSAPTEASPAQNDAMTAPRLAALAGLLADDTRATFLLALLDGRAWTAGELAGHARVAPATATGHLHKLVAGGLLIEQRQGRHRYVQLAGPHVAQLVEDLAAHAGTATTPVTTLRGATATAAMTRGRTCYDHLAGKLGVALHDRLVELDAVRIGPDGATLTEGGVGLLAELGVVATRERTRPLVRQCLDWSQRRHHLAGTVGVGLLDTMLDRGWLHRNATRRRELRLSRAGREGLRAHLGIEVT